MSEPLGHGRLSNSADGPGDIRLWPLVFVVLGLFTVFVGRLFQLQILEGEYLKGRSQANYVRTVQLDAPRGMIVDRDGRAIAASRPAYHVDVMPNEIQHPWRTWSVLGAILARDPQEIAAKVGKPKGRLRFQPVSLATDLSFEERAQVAEHHYALPGVEFYGKPLREYVYGSLAAQLLGTIGEIDARELEREEFADYHSGETIGKTGIEASYETHLRGRTGGVNRIVDVAGREIEELDRIEPTPGGRVVLAMDLDLQQAAEESFLTGDPAQPRRMGAVVALDPNNGDVLAMVSSPNYDANAFAGAISRDVWRALNDDEWHPMRNRAVAGAYPPGSTYKAFVAAAGLAEKMITPANTAHCNGYYRLGRRTYRCWKKGGHGTVDLKRALAGSCDVYFYELGRKLGVETLARYAKLFGLGAPTGIAVRGESPGLVPTPEWKRRVKREAWVEGETISLSIGQGANLVTPIQLAVAYATIANGGTVVTPRVVLRKETWDGELVEELRPEIRASKVVDPAILEIVRQGLMGVVMDPGGTGRRAQVPGINVGGKSGTTQVVSLDVVKGLEPKNIPIRYRDHALFAAFAPVEAPEIVVVAVVEHAGGGGGAIAAPMTQKVMAKYFSKKEGRIPTEVAFLDGDGRGGPRRAPAGWLEEQGLDAESEEGR
ncbi:MAG: penicillin-binding protein 2 [Myxococcota bacterium]